MHTNNRAHAVISHSRETPWRSPRHVCRPRINIGKPAGADRQNGGHGWLEAAPEQRTEQPAERPSESRSALAAEPMAGMIVVAIAARCPTGGPFVARGRIPTLHI